MARYLPIINDGKGAVLWTPTNGLPEVMSLEIARAVLEVSSDLASRNEFYRESADDLQAAITAAEGVPALSFGRAA